MKNKWLLVLMVAVCALAFAGNASAETYVPKNCLYVKASPTGLVTMKGDPGDIAEYLRQFCPDIFKYPTKEWPKGCGNTFSVKQTAPGTYQLDMQAVKDGQRSFNGKEEKFWLYIPHPLVVVEEGLLIERSAPSSDSEDGKGGAHFTLIADLEGQDYKVLYPTSQGGEACRETKVEVVAPPEAKVEVKVTSPAPKVATPAKQDSSVKVTGNKNLTAKQGSAAVKGKINTTGVGVNVRGNHNAISVTVINGKPEYRYDSTCAACHSNSPYNKK